MSTEASSESTEADHTVAQRYEVQKLFHRAYGQMHRGWSDAVSTEALWVVKEAL